jgi:hypothetical protein
MFSGRAINESVDARLARLERNNSLLLRIVTFLCLGFTVFALLAAGPNDTHKKVTAGEFQLVDANGRKRAILGLKDGLPFLAFLSPGSATPSVEIGISSKGTLTWSSAPAQQVAPVQKAPTAPLPKAQGTETEPVQKARFNITVKPDTIGIEIGKYSVVSYRFREVAGTGATIESQDIKWVLPDGTELYAEKGNRILGGSFSVDARGTYELLDNVYLPPNIASEAFERGQNQVQLETTFSAVDYNDHVVRAKAILRIGILASR